MTANEGLYQTFVILACVCWGFEKDTRQIVIIKGLGSGTASLLISFIIHEGSVGITAALAVMILGFLAVGLSVYFYVLAQGESGAARTSAYYAVSPFMGVLLSLLLFRQMPGKIFWAALIIMGVGVYFNNRRKLCLDSTVSGRGTDRIFADKKQDQRAEKRDVRLWLRVRRLQRLRCP